MKSYLWCEIQTFEVFGVGPRYCFRIDAVFLSSSAEEDDRARWTIGILTIHPLTSTNVGSSCIGPRYAMMVLLGVFAGMERKTRARLLNSHRYPVKSVSPISLFVFRSVLFCRQTLAPKTSKPAAMRFQHQEWYAILTLGIKMVTPCVYLCSCRGLTSRKHRAAFCEVSNCLEGAETGKRSYGMGLVTGDFAGQHYVTLFVVGMNEHTSQRCDTVCLLLSALTWCQDTRFKI